MVVVMARYMIIERFDPANLAAIYERLHTKGRGLPDGLLFIDSWLTADDSAVYQLMETDDPALFEVWCAYWSDLVSFEIMPLREKPSAPAS